MNPFAQSAQIWRVTFDLPRAVAAMAENAFDDVALAVSSFEREENPAQWKFELLLSEKPDAAEIKRRLLVLTALHDAPVPDIHTDIMQQKDWVSEVAKSFPPIREGSFFVHGSHYEGRVPPGAISLLVDAGAAFGSGEHATTSGCLSAFEWLAKKRSFANMLDMGCGSGILAMAAAKRLKCDCRAVDIDAVAVKVTQQNIRRNRVHAQVRAEVSDGYRSNFVQAGAPYDLIFSNILARPLVKFAPALAKALAPGGVAILAGLLASQEAFVAEAHKKQGLRLLRRIQRGEWMILVFTAPA